MGSIWLLLNAFTWMQWPGSGTCHVENLRNESVSLFIILNSSPAALFSYIYDHVPINHSTDPNCDQYNLKAALTQNLSLEGQRFLFNFICVSW